MSLLSGFTTNPDQIEHMYEKYRERILGRMERTETLSSRVQFNSELDNDAYTENICCVVILVQLQL